MNFACPYPEEVTKAISSSGLYRVHRFLDGYWDDFGHDWPWWNHHLPRFLP